MGGKFRSRRGREKNALKRSPEWGAAREVSVSVTEEQELNHRIGRTTTEMAMIPSFILTSFHSESQQEGGD